MKQNNISFSFKEFDKAEDLDAEDRELLAAAQKATANSYSPYSGFSVGAALRLESGRIVTGTNVENAAFPSGICAERNAISNAVSNHPGDKPVALAIAAFSGSSHTSEPVAPCGNCRQVIAEEENRNGISIRIILGGSSKIRIIGKGADLLPLQFNSESLRITPR
ncbi:MAG: cytidine deaminase [Bacteroidales bacterium]|jgi:cytidine deaminase|nr:cytidine deaminase [Bacteroidales bacterium]